MTSAGPTPAAPPPTDDDPRERMAFSSHGKTRYIVLRGDWGKRLDRHIVRWTGFSVITW